MLVSNLYALDILISFKVYLLNIFLYFSDELPVQLTLPRALREAANRQQLSSLALLGQEFWSYPMANPRPSAINTPTTATTSPIPASSISKTESSGIGTTVFSANQQKLVTSNSQHTVGNFFSPGTPSDGTSSLSSFTSTGQQILSPESIDSVVLTMSPVDNQRNGIVGKTSTFKLHNQNRKSLDLDKIPLLSNNLSNALNNNLSCENNIGNGNVRSVRPTPPSTLNLRIPPAPPPRWTKSTTPSSPTESLTPTIDVSQSMNNLAGNVDNANNSQNAAADLLSPNANVAVNKHFNSYFFDFIKKVNLISFLILVPNDFKTALTRRRMPQNVSRHLIFTRIKTLAKPIKQRFQSK